MLTKEQLTKLFRNLDGLTINVTVVDPFTKVATNVFGRVEVEINRHNRVEEIMVGNVTLFYEGKFEGQINMIRIDNPLM